MCTYYIRVSENLPSFSGNSDDDDEDDADDGGDVMADADIAIVRQPAKMLRRHLGCFLLNYVKNAFVMTLVRCLALDVDLPCIHVHLVMYMYNVYTYMYMYKDTAVYVHNVLPHGVLHRLTDSCSTPRPLCLQDMKFFQRKSPLVALYWNCKDFLRIQVVATFKWCCLQTHT